MNEYTKCGIIVQQNIIWPLKKSRLLIHATTQMGLGNFILNENASHRK